MFSVKWRPFCPGGDELRYPVSLQAQVEDMLKSQLCAQLGPFEDEVRDIKCVECIVSNALWKLNAFVVLI